MANYSPVNPCAFDVLTEDALYWIGFLMADGSVTEDKGTTSQWKLSLVLAEEDRAHVVTFCKFLNLTPPPPTSQSSLVKGKRYPIVRKSVRNDHLCKTLMSYGVVPNKTAHAKAAPAVASSLAFWRGVFDGDGSLTIDPRNGSVSLELAGSQELLTQFCTFAAPFYPNAKTYPAGKLYTPAQMGTKKVFRVSMGGPLSHTLLAALYDAPGPRLARKEAKFRAWQAQNWASKRGEYQVESTAL